MYKAALLLEEEGQEKAAETLLRDAIGVSTIAGQYVDLIRARTFLGELLVHLQRRPEALEEFRGVLSLSASTTLDADAVDEELANAQRWVEKLSSGE